MRLFFPLTVLLFFGITGCKKQKDDTEPNPNPSFIPQVEIKTLLSDQGIIWGFDFLPDGRMVFTQKTGALRVFETGTNTTQIITGLPSDISATGQGGLLDVCVSPDFSGTGLVFITYTVNGGFLRLASFTLSGTVATNWKVLQETESPCSWSGHYGGRLAFSPDRKLFWAVGEGGGGSHGGATSPHQNGQNLNTKWGKIHRLNPDGTVPADNPLINGIRSTIFSYGHRNPQGLAVEPATGKLFSTEHGPKGGCELNLIGLGNNYGWPLYSAGVNYDDTNISNGSHAATGITPPLKFWIPALAPSGLSFINHPSFGSWNGNLLSGSLGRRHLLMIHMANGNPGSETVLLENIGRVRNVKQGPSGKIYVSVEEGGRLLELSAK